MDNQIVINIRKLGSVRNAQITLSQFMIFSGASGLGKSYVAMLVHYVYKVLTGEILKDFVKLKNITLKDVVSYNDNEQHEVYSFDSKELLMWLNVRAKEYIQNMLGYSNLEMDVEIIFPKLPEFLSMFCWIRKYSDSTAYATLSVNQEERTNYGVSLSIIDMVETEVIAEVLASYICLQCSITNRYATLFFPPSRGSLMQLSAKDRYNFVQSSPMYKEYMQSLLEIRSSHFYNRNPQPISTTKIVDGEIIEDEDEYVYSTHGSKLPISATASSIKEIAPLLLLAQKGNVHHYSILFEEPESHLHPEMQIGIVDVIAQMIAHRAEVQITTHSDYVLRRINDLIYLYKIKEAWKDEDKFNAFCKKYDLDSSLALDPSKIKAYFFKATKSGTSKVIQQDLSDGIPFDTFENVINTNFPISAEIYEQFELVK